MTNTITIRSKESFNGLSIGETMLQGPVVGILGRNGAGKSRFLQAIVEAKIMVIREGKSGVSTTQLLSSDQMLPQISFGYDQAARQGHISSIRQIYGLNRGKFSHDPVESLTNLSPQNFPSPSRGAPVMNMQQLVHIVSVAAKATRRGPNDLTDADLEDYLAFAPVQSLGSLDVTATMRGYAARREDNAYAIFRNREYGESNQVYDDTQFLDKFGPPPWQTFNRFLNNVFGGRYHIMEPPVSMKSPYEANLFRDDGKEINQSMLSSGEKTLMWLCLSMYATNSNRASSIPSVLLLDEPDRNLHPQMVQSLHVALNTIVTAFQTSVIFTTHSPTTVALFEAGSLYRITETSLTEVEKDVAIGELLVGVDQISLYSTNRRQVYVESYRDAQVYESIFSMLRAGGLSLSGHVSLSFSAAAPKLSPSSVEELLSTHLQTSVGDKERAFVNALNGQGNCAQVIGIVSDLVNEGNPTAHGIIDWDLINEPQRHIHVHGLNTFYSLENAVLNALTLGIYLAVIFSNKVELADLGLPENFDPAEIYQRTVVWQAIADAVTLKVLSRPSTKDVVCKFSSVEIKLDSGYCKMHGHKLEEMILLAYPFLKSVPRRPGLLLDVVMRAIKASGSRTLPESFCLVFRQIQSAQR